MNDTTTKCALVTGASQRIGADIARELHRRNFNVIVHYRESQSQATELARQLNADRNNSAVCLQADLSCLSEVQQLAIDASNVWGRIDALVNNASSFYPTPIKQASEQDWNTLVDSNLKGPFFLSQAFITSLEDTRGCIVNLIDIFGEKPMSEHCIYSIAKAGVTMMTKTQAKELAPHIRVNGVSPGAILWPEKNLSEEEKASILNKVPMQHIGATADIACTVAFLVCDAPYISGQVIAVDGGRSLNI